ncbi:DUF596 domain-containing protein [Wohlfahrtiimonas larvae]|uniref:DUF596 domain-containing protein n=1 Tax=Wohlfahrtiimonas larvae TaxID=1157986 RepID=A0ABP9MJ52_9GAMM|nr:DUF596 domain-containing protein [Wohlfahrtiimonas larvae]
MLNEEQLDNLYNWALQTQFQFSLNTMWFNFCIELQKIDEQYDFESVSGFQLRTQAFFSLLEKMLLNEKVKFNYMGTKNLVNLPVKEQLRLIENKWPCFPYINEDNDLDDLGLWWWIYCPVGIVWIVSDGNYVWT